MEKDFEEQKETIAKEITDKKQKEATELAKSTDIEMKKLKT